MLNPNEFHQCHESPRSAGNMTYPESCGRMTVVQPRLGPATTAVATSVFVRPSRR